MRERLLRWTPRWAVSVLWVLGMLVAGLAPLGFLAYAVVFLTDVLIDGELGLIPGVLLLGIGGLMMGREWWRELQRWREVVPPA